MIRPTPGFVWSRQRRAAIEQGGALVRAHSDMSGIPIFEEAFYRRTGVDFVHAEERFWHSHSIWYRWVPILTSSATLWMAITLLSLFAVKRRRDRTAEIKRQWEEEERWLDGGSDDLLH